MTLNHNSIPNLYAYKHKEETNMKNFWIAAEVEENGKYSAFAFKVSENDNLVSEMTSIRNLCFANIMPSKKAADEVVAAWNEAHKANGNYLFAE